MQNLFTIFVFVVLLALLSLLPAFERNLDAQQRGGWTPVVVFGRGA
jgi:hypothetical protein